MTTRDCLCNIMFACFTTLLWRFFSPSRPLLCGKQPTLSGETWVTLGGMGSTTSRPYRSKWAPVLDVPPLPRWPMHSSPCAVQLGIVHSGSESLLAACMILRLLHNCFVYSQPCDFSSTRLSWIAICSTLACQLVFHYHSMFPPHIAQAIFLLSCRTS